MCGICGIVGNTKERERVLERMMKIMEHRGPDGGDTYYLEDAAFGFRRLSIIDLDTGMQPMLNEDGDMVMVFNGEIYNYRILRCMLEQKGHKFRSESDSEVLLHGYEEYGSGFLEKLRGMFGFAIWDGKKKQLFAARDFFGIKPFYYAVIEGVFVFASEIKSILEFPGYRRQVNEDALEHYLSFQYSVLPETFFKGIYQLLPGHFLMYEGQTVKTKWYFDPSLRPDHKEKLSGIIKEIEDVMRQSVRRYLVSDVEVGSFLSSGVDSSLVTALSGCRQTFTVGFKREGKKYDEITSARKLTKELEIENHAKYITSEEFFEVMPKVLYHMDESLGDASAVALYFLAEEASKRVKVVLSGEGADEMFGGYNIYLEPKMLGIVSWIPLGVRKEIARAAMRLPRHMKGRNYLIRAASPVSEQYIGNANIFSYEEREQLMKNGQNTQKPAKLLEDTYAKISDLPDLEQMQYIDLMYWLPDLSGVDVCKMLTEQYNIPIVMLTARGMIDDKVYGLESGADDYITKPFDLREVIVRVKAILRRFGKTSAWQDEEKKQTVRIGDMVISERERTVCQSGENIELTPKEFDLLIWFVRNPRQVFTRTHLLDQIWGYDFIGDTRTVDIHVQRIRKKLHLGGSIITVFGVGYKYVPEE